jgi:hypothetical protein
MRPRTALCTGFLLQTGALVLAYRLPALAAATGPRWPWLVLAPGVVLFWDGGIHSAHPLLGLLAAAALDSALFGGLVYGVARWWFGAPDPATA